MLMERGGNINGRERSLREREREREVRVVVS